MSKQQPFQFTQDWKPVQLSKPKSVAQGLKDGTLTKKIKEKEGAAKNTQTTTDISAAKLEENEIGRHKTSSRTLAMQIQQARLAKNLSQDDLNKKCNFPKGTVTSYENGKAIVNSTELRTMSTNLGINLKK